MRKDLKLCGKHIILNSYKSKLQSNPTALISDIVHKTANINQSCAASMYYVILKYKSTKNYSLQKNKTLQVN